MIHQTRHEEPEMSTGDAKARQQNAPAGQSLQSTSSAGENPNPTTLTPDEQMALFEKELKENDWGHQPC